MIGNDLIDLQLASQESNWKRKHYLEKIFSIKERDFISKQKNQNFYVWLYWSMKEASYKIIHRHTTVRIFNPWKYECILIKQSKSHFEGMVRYENNVFFVRSESNQKYLHSIAVEKMHYFNKIQTFQNQQNIDKTSFLKSHLNGEEFFFKNEHQIPYIGNRKCGNKKVASLSHHGKAIALIIYDCNSF